MSTNKAKPELLSLPQIADIHTHHPPTGKALQAIVDYINKMVPPLQGTKIKKRAAGNAA